MNIDRLHLTVMTADKTVRVHITDPAACAQALRKADNKSEDATFLKDLSGFCDDATFLEDLSGFCDDATQGNPDAGVLELTAENVVSILAPDADKSADEHQQATGT